MIVKWKEDKELLVAVMQRNRRRRIGREDLSLASAILQIRENNQWEIEREVSSRRRKRKSVLRENTLIVRKGEQDVFVYNNAGNAFISSSVHRSMHMAAKINGWDWRVYFTNWILSSSSYILPSKKKKTNTLEMEYNKNRGQVNMRRCDY